MEITVHNCVRRNDQTVFVRVTEQMETKNEAKIKAMKDVVAEFIPRKDGVQVEVRDSRDTLMNSYRRSMGMPDNRQTSSKPRLAGANNDDRITDKQIGLIREKLQKSGTSESDFCEKHQVDSIKAIPKHDAQWIIKELIANDKKR